MHFFYNNEYVYAYKSLMREVNTYIVFTVISLFTINNYNNNNSNIKNKYVSNSFIVYQFVNKFQTNTKVLLVLILNN